MSRTLRRALAHTGWLVSGLALPALWLATGGPVLGAPLAAAASLLLLLGGAVGVGVVWTLAQAAIHTRLGSRPMLPDAPSAAPRVSARRALLSMAVLTAAVAAGLWPLLAEGALAWGALALVGLGLGFGTELAWVRLGDRLSGRAGRRLPDRHGAA